MSPAHDLANRQSGSVSLYVDGIKQGATYDVNPVGSSHGNGWIQGIGRDYASNGQSYFPGDIADVRIYAYESGSAGMTAEEVKWLYLNPGEGGQIQGDPETNPRYQGQNIGIGYRTVGAGHIMDDMVDGEITDFRLAHSQTGVLNVGVGNTALQDITEGSKNVGVGWRAGWNITTGTYNVAIGGLAGDDLITGNNNTYIGHNADASTTSVSSEIVIAATPNAGGHLGGGGTETIRIGAASDYITNDFGENATWTHSSDRRIKIGIKDNTLGLDFINKLKTRNFKKKAPSEYPEEFDQHSPNITERKNPDRIHYGFVAQEVKEAMDEVGHSEFPVWKENRDGMQELGETELITPLVKAVQELTEIVKSQQKEIEELKNKQKIVFRIFI